MYGMEVQGHTGALTLLVHRYAYLFFCFYHSQILIYIEREVLMSPLSTFKNNNKRQLPQLQCAANP